MIDLQNKFDGCLEIEDASRLVQKLLKDYRKLLMRDGLCSGDGKIKQKAQPEFDNYKKILEDYWLEVFLREIKKVKT